MVQPVFGRERMALYADIMSRHAATMVDSWNSGQVLDISEFFHDFTIEIVCMALFGTEISEQTTGDVKWSIDALSKGMVARILWPHRFFEKLPIPVNRKFDEGLSRIRNVVGGIVRANRARQGDEKGTLLDALLAVRDERTGAGLSDQQIRDEVTAFLLAGSETAATTLAWFFHELGQHPDIEQRILAELDAHATDQPFSYLDIAKLEYLQHAFKETLRLHAPAWMLMRRTTAPVDLGGVHIPAESEVLFSPTAVHRNPNIYPDPMRFNPDRWLSEHDQIGGREAYLPFGYGNRKCIGDNFALLEMMMVAATIMKRWRLVPVPGSKVQEKAFTTIIVRGLSMRLSPRMGV
jgi:cyclooctat-9-en-7-ol 5-monooxygenase